LLTEGKGEEKGEREKKKGVVKRKESYHRREKKRLRVPYPLSDSLVRGGGERKMEGKREKRSQHFLPRLLKSKERG